jgi:mono/diheme cytochrome c family protein
MILRYSRRERQFSGAAKQSFNTMRATNRFSSLKPGLLAGTGLVVIAAAAYTVFCPFVYADRDSKPKKEAKEKATKEKTKNVASPEQQKLTGQQLYAINCNRCHSERYPTEFTVAHWRTVMMHMRVRANLPADQAKEILKYLEQDAGN